MKIEKKKLEEYSNEELIFVLENNEKADRSWLCFIMSEILKRMNKIKPILKEDKQYFREPS